MFATFRLSKSGFQGMYIAGRMDQTFAFVSKLLEKLRLWGPAIESQGLRRAHGLVSSYSFIGFIWIQLDLATRARARR